MFLEECKYAMKDRKIINTINEPLKLKESDDESNENVFLILNQLII